MVAQRMRDHPAGDRKQQNHADIRIFDDFGSVDRMHRVGGEIQRGPTSADQAPAENRVQRAPFNEDAADQHDQANSQSHGDADGCPDAREFVTQIQRDADHEDQHAKLVQPASAHQRFPFLIADFGAEAVAQTELRNR
jgi:hypothetical protein